MASFTSRQAPSRIRERDDDRDQRVGRRPPRGHDDESGGDGAHGPQKVAEDVEVGPSDVQVVRGECRWRRRAPAMFTPSPSHGDHQEQRAVHLRWGPEPLPRLLQDENAR